MTDSFPESRISLRPRTHHIVLEELEVEADIGFHDYEIGAPQRLLVTVDVTVDMQFWPKTDSADAAWDYDFIRTAIHNMVRGRRFNLQETLAEEIFSFVARRPGVTAVTIHTRKTDIYPDARSVGVVLSSE